MENNGSSWWLQLLNSGVEMYQNYQQNQAQQTLNNTLFLNNQGKLSLANINFKTVALIAIAAVVGVYFVTKK